MKHNLRSDKTCLNCGFQVEEQYCSRCGQENTEPRESLGHLIGHFLSDITHYDSKFLTSLRDLVVKPGFLTKEYNAGRRASYLNPIRMYVFISAVFFIVLFGGSEEGPAPVPEAHPAAAAAFSQRLADSLRKAAPAGDSVRRSIYGALATRLDTPQAVAKGSEGLGFHLNSSGKGNDLVTDLDVVEDKYQRIPQYDSIQAALPDSTRDGAVVRWARHRMIHLRQEHPGKGILVIRQDVGHNVPKLMFVLLPLFAAFVGWFYSRKKYRYTQHVIFSLHFHSFAFIVFLLGDLVLLPDPAGFVVKAVFWVSLLLIYTYLSLALARTHAEAIWLSFIKALALCILYVLVLLIAILLVGVVQFYTA